MSINKRRHAMGERDAPPSSLAELIRSAESACKAWVSARNSAMSRAYDAGRAGLLTDYDLGLIGKHSAAREVTLAALTKADPARAALIRRDSALAWNSPWQHDGSPPVAVHQGSLFGNEVAAEGPYRRGRR
jgi:hypothetical protein